MVFAEKRMKASGRESVDCRTVAGMPDIVGGLVEVCLPYEMIVEVKPLIVFFSSIYSPASLQALRTTSYYN